MGDQVQIDREVLQKTFDTAVNSMDFGSGFLDDDEVAALRAVAVVLGVDPLVATPMGFKCKYGQPHAFSAWHRPYADLRGREKLWTRYCTDCKHRENREQMEMPT